jgi:hypothetical protein
MLFDSKRIFSSQITKQISEQIQRRQRNVKKISEGGFSMSDISTFRLYLLRAGYLIIAVGLALMIWSKIIFPSDNVPHMNAVVRSMLGAVSLLAIVGIFYPLKMLPVLLFEVLWKSIWILAFGLRLWSADKLDSDTAATLNECIFGVVLGALVTPWDYVFKHYLKAQVEPWRKQIIENKNA